MRDDAAPVTLYLHPDARKALKRYALEQDLKVHDLLLEAVEEWFRSHGLGERVRVQSEKNGRAGATRVRHDATAGQRRHPTALRFRRAGTLHGRCGLSGSPSSGSYPLDGTHGRVFHSGWFGLYSRP